MLEVAAKRFGVNFKVSPSAIQGSALEVKTPRVGLYKSWIAALDEGWTRFVLDTNGVPYKSIVDADIRKGNLIDEFDAIILPDNPANAILTGRLGGGRSGGGQNRLAQPQAPEEYQGGLGPDGIRALKAFVDAGGTIIANNKAADVYATKEHPAITNALEGVPPKEFLLPRFYPRGERRHEQPRCL